MAPKVGAAGTLGALGAFRVVGAGCGGAGAGAGAVIGLAMMASVRRVI